MTQTPNEMAAHLAHCGQGEYLNTCKYGESETCPALSRPTPARQFDAGEVEAIRHLAAEFERWLSLGPNGQPHFPGRGRPFSTGDLKFFVKALRALTDSAPAPDGLVERWSWGYSDGIPGTPEYEPPSRICNWCKTVEARCQCDASVPLATGGAS